MLTIFRGEFPSVPELCKNCASSAQSSAPALAPEIGSDIEIERRSLVAPYWRSVMTPWRSTRRS